MVWPFSSVQANTSIEAHLRLRDRALALPLPPPSTASTGQLELEIKKGSFNSDPLQPSPDAPVSSLDLAILTSDLAGITAGIKARKWTATDALSAFIRSAKRAHARTNCVTEVNIQQALVRANELDRYFEQTGELIGPLHGVPMSFKDMYHIRGLPLTIGFTSYLSKSNSSDSASLVLIAEHLGAVPFIKTNVPQTMLAFECNNPVFGRTLNPFSPHHTCGGSSGGESALIASDGSAVGVGSDVGGSLRIPVGYCGIYSLKPSARKWTMQGTVDFARGFEGVDVVAGPICRSAQDLELIHSTFSRALQPPAVSSGDQDGTIEGKDVILAAAEHDALLQKVGLANSPIISFNQAWFRPLQVAEKRGKPLRVGYILTDGFIKTTPACYRAVKESVEALQAKYPSSQVEVVKIPASALDAVTALELFLKMTAADGYRSLTDPHIGKDKLDVTLLLPLFLARMPNFLRRTLFFVARYILRDRLLSRCVAATRTSSAAGYFKAVEARSRWREAWNKRIWDGYSLDALLAPVQASPAIPHKAAGSLSMLVSSTSIFNILDSSVAVLPVTRVNLDTDSHKASDYKAATDAQRQSYDEWASDPELRQCSHLVNFELYYKGVYDVKKMEGLPVGVQVVTRAFNEEKAIGIMRLLDDALPPMAERGSVWKNQLDAQGKVVPVAKAPIVRAGFGPGQYTKSLYA